MIPEYESSTPDLVDDRTEQARMLQTSLWAVALFGAGLIPPVLIAAGFFNSFFSLNYVADRAQMMGGLVYVLIGTGIQLASTIAVWVIGARLVRILGRRSSTSTVLSVFVAIWLAGTVTALTFYAAVFFQN